MEGENVSLPVLYEANTTNFFNKGLGTLPDALTAVVTEERNGEFIFEMTYPADGARSGLLENNRIIKVDAGHVLTDQRFVIKKTTPQMSEDGKIYIDVYAEHISYITNDLALKPSVTVSGSANDAMQQWQKAIIDSNEITADSDISTNNSTSWTIDKVQNARLALGGVDGSILDVWGGEYLFDNLHISLRKQRGSLANALLAYGRNITSFQQEENIEDTYTSIYPYATLNSVSGDTPSLYTIDNYVVDSQYIGNYPNRKILPVDFSSNFENVKVGTKASDASDSDTTVYMTVAEVQSQLKALAQQYITNNDVGIPTVSISVSFVDLSKTSNYADVAPLEQLDLCDIVPVRFTKLGIDTTAKVTHAEWNVLTDSYDKIELGSITPTLGQTLNTLTTVAQAAKQVAQDAQNNATIAWQSADGKTTTFKGSSSQAFPTAQHIGDLYWRENGDTTEVYIWDGSEWAFQFSIKTGQNISEAVDKAMAEADTATKNANTAVETGNQALTKAQVGIDAANAAADNANTAMSNSSTAINNAKSAMADAATAISTANNSSDIANAVQQQITTLKDGSTMTIADLENGLALKLTKSDLDGYATQSWASNQISATANGLQTQVTSVKNTADKATTDITTLNQRADGWDNSITSLSTNKADQTWTTNQIKASADSLNVNIAKVQTQVNNSVVGTNLAEHTLGQIASLSKVTLPVVGDDIGMPTLDTMNSLVGKTITVSLNISWTGYESANNNRLGWEMSWMDVNGNQHYYGVWVHPDSNASGSGRYSATFDVGTTEFDHYSEHTPFVQCKVASASFSNLKIELGSTATDYSANPADNATVTSVTNLSVTLEGLKSTVSQKVDNTTFTSYQTQTATLIGSKVASTDFNSYKTQTDNALSQRVTSSAFSSYQTQTDSAIQQRVTSATYNAEITTLSNQINSKVSSDTFNSQIQQLSNNINLRVTTDQANQLISNSKMIKDTRNDNQPPSWYLTNYPQTTATEFKTASVVGLSNSTYAYVETVSPWHDSTGGVLTQTARTDAGTFKRMSTNTSAWGSWVQIADTSNVVNQINISTEGILIDGKRTHITGSTTIDDAVIKSAMIDSLSADKITAGTLNAANVNVINLNANNISSGTLTGISFHQSSSGHDTWIDGDGIHDYDGSGNNAWIQKGVLQVYDSNNYGFFMSAGELQLSSASSWGSSANPVFGTIKRDTGIFSTSGNGMIVQGTDGLSLRSKSFDSSYGVMEQSSRYTGSGINLIDSSILMASNGRTIITSGTTYTEYLTTLPKIEIGTNRWDPNGTGGSAGQNIAMQANGIMLDLNGGMYVNSYNGSNAEFHNMNVKANSFTNSSQLSLKTNIRTLNVDNVRNAIRNVDIRQYQYKLDIQNGKNKFYVSGIIDDVNEKPQYNIPYDWISEDGTGRDDGTALGYAIIAIQDLYDQIDALEDEIKQLKGAA